MTLKESLRPVTFDQKWWNNRRAKILYTAAQTSTDSAWQSLIDAALAFELLHPGPELVR